MDIFLVDTDLMISRTKVNLAEGAGTVQSIQYILGSGYVFLTVCLFKAL